ncbi:MAG: DUF4492 domain-containing protein [Bacteroides sp.]
MSNLLQRIFRFYYDGFRSMTVGRTLWIMIVIKLTIMFLILRIFFFPNFLKTNFETDEARSEYVLQELTRQRK